MPVSGNNFRLWGRKRPNINLKMDWFLEVKEDSFVTSPMDGTVVYANKFKSFGNSSNDKRQ